MHPSVMEWARQRVTVSGLWGVDWLDVGAYNVNGTVRDLGEHGAYLGVDYRAGPNVDLVADAAALPFADGSFPVVWSTEMLEHCLDWETALTELIRVSRSDVLLTCRGPGFPPHDYPHDYHRFERDQLGDWFSEHGCELEDLRDDPTCPGVFLHAVVGD